MYLPLTASDQSEKIYFYNEIELPWKLSEWKVHVTSAKSTTEIWARLHEKKFKVSESKGIQLTNFAFSHPLRGRRFWLFCRHRSTCFR